MTSFEDEPRKTAISSSISPISEDEKSQPRKAGFFYWVRIAYAFCLISAWAAARRAMGTRNGEQET